MEFFNSLLRERRFMRRIALDFFIPLLAAALGSLATLYLVRTWGAAGTQKMSGFGSIIVRDMNSFPGVEVGETVHPPALPEIKGVAGSSGLLRGRPARYAFFSAACASCTLDSQTWRRLSSEAAKNGSDFFLVGLDQTRDEIVRFADEHGIGDMPVLYDPEGEARRRFKIHVFPQYILLTAHSRVALRWTGVSFGRPDQNESSQIATLFGSLPKE